MWPGRDDGVMLSDADRAVLFALPRYGVLSWQQVCRHFYGGDEARTAQRLMRLRDLGLVEQSAHEGWPGMVLWASSTAVALVNREARVPLAAGAAPSMSANLLHRLAVNDVALKYEANGATVLTEREVRAVEQGDRSAADLAAQIGSPGRPVLDGKGRARYFATPLEVAESSVYLPDLVVVTASKLIAVEIELTVKERSRGFKIMRGYHRETPFTDVYYMCTPEVQMALTGFWTGGGQVWRDGWLQELAMLPRNTPYAHLTPAQRRQSRVQVWPLAVDDEAILWKLDMREVSPMQWLSKRDWRALRAVWDAHSSAALADGSRMPFVAWWRQMWPMVKVEQQAYAKTLWTDGQAAREVAAHLDGQGEGT